MDDQAAFASLADSTKAAFWAATVVQDPVSFFERASASAVGFDAAFAGSTAS